MKRLVLLLPVLLLFLFPAAEADSVQYFSDRSLLTVECDHAVPGTAVSFMAVRGTEDNFSVSPDHIHYLRQLPADGNGHVSLSLIGSLTEDYVFLLGGSSEDGQLHVIGCFSLSNSSRLSLPSAVTAVLEESFMGDTSLETVILGSEVTVLEDRAFMNCTGLIWIEIPETVVQIGEDVFAGCPGLTIACAEGSAAQAYAESNQIPVHLLDQ